MLRIGNDISVGEEFGEFVLFSGHLVERAQEFSLNVAREATPFAAPLDHFMGDVLGGSRHEIV